MQRLLPYLVLALISPNFIGQVIPNELILDSIPAPFLMYEIGPLKVDALRAESPDKHGRQYFETILNTTTNVTRKSSYYQNLQLAKRKFEKVVDDKVVLIRNQILLSKDGDTIVNVDYSKGAISACEDSSYMKKFNSAFESLIQKFEKHVGSKFFACLDLDTASTIGTSVEFGLSIDDFELRDYVIFFYEIIGYNDVRVKFDLSPECGLDSVSSFAIDLPQKIKPIKISRKNLENTLISNGMTQDLKPYEIEISINHKNQPVAIVRAVTESTHESKTLSHHTISCAKVNLYNGKFEFLKTEKATVITAY